MSGCVRILLAISLSASLLLGCKDEEPNQEEQAAGNLVRDFYFHLLDPAGQPETAYDLLDSTSKALCQASEVRDLSAFGRFAVAERDLNLDIEDVEVEGNKAAVSIEISFGGVVGFPVLEHAIAVREDEGWRYVIQTDPTCDSEAAFFGMTSIPTRVIPTDRPGCHPAYSLTCVAPPPPLLTCQDIGIRPLIVVEHPDPHGLDPDRDGFACVN